MYGARSLYELLRVNADHYVQIGKSFGSAKQFFDGGLFGSVLTIGDFQASVLVESLRAIHSHCLALQLEVASGLIEEFFSEYSKSLPTLEVVKQRVEMIERAFRIELASRLFIFILPHRTPYFSDEQTTGSEVGSLEGALENFQSARFDLYEAGVCFATGRFTACAHHLSKVVEFGLVSFGTFAGVTDPINWNTALNQANANLRGRIGKFNGATAADEQYYSEAIGLLRNFKTAWRNPVSHIPEVFNEPKAKALFSIVKATMEHLSKRFGEVPIPNKV